MNTLVRNLTYHTIISSGSSNALDAFEHDFMLSWKDAVGYVVRKELVPKEIGMKEVGNLIRCMRMIRDMGVRDNEDDDDHGGGGLGEYGISTFAGRYVNSHAPPTDVGEMFKIWLPIFSSACSLQLHDVLVSEGGWIDVMGWVRGVVTGGYGGIWRDWCEGLVVRGGGRGGRRYLEENWREAWERWTDDDRMVGLGNVKFGDRNSGRMGDIEKGGKVVVEVKEKRDHEEEDEVGGVMAAYQSKADSRKGVPSRFPVKTVKLHVLQDSEFRDSTLGFFMEVKMNFSGTNGEVEVGLRDGGVTGGGFRVRVRWREGEGAVVAIIGKEGREDETRKLGEQGVRGVVTIKVKGVPVGDVGCGRVWAGLEGGGEGVEGRFKDGSVFNRDVKTWIEGIGGNGNVKVEGWEWQGRRGKGIEGAMEEKARREVLEMEDDGDRGEARKALERIEGETARVLGMASLEGCGDIQVEPVLEDVCWNVMEMGGGRDEVKVAMNSVARRYASAWILKSLGDESWRCCMKGKERQTKENGVWMKRIFVLRARMARWAEEVRARLVEDVAGGWRRGAGWEEERKLWMEWWRGVEKGSDLMGLSGGGDGNIRDMQGLATRLFVIIKELGIEGVGGGEIERLEKEWEAREIRWKEEWGGAEGF